MSAGSWWKLRTLRHDYSKAAGAEARRLIGEGGAWPAADHGFSEEVVSAAQLLKGSRAAMHEWRRFSDVHRVGDIVPGRVVALTSSYIIVEIAPSVRGIVMQSQLPKRVDAKAGNLEGATIDVRLLSLDPNSRYAELSLEFDSGSNRSSLSSSPEMPGDPDV